MSGPKLSEEDYRAACEFREVADRRQFRMLLSVDTTNLVYRTRCDRCGADVWVWKWKYG